MAKSPSSSLAVEVDHDALGNEVTPHAITANTPQEQGTPAMPSLGPVQQQLATLPSESMLHRYLDEIRPTELTLNENVKAKSILGGEGADKS